MQKAIDHGNVDTAGAVFQAQFFDDARVGIFRVVRQDRFQYQRTHVAISRFLWWCTCRVGSHGGANYRPL
ncbi:MAG: hypothetical protein BGP22_09520 [Variovorax sp. 67-131]|nr:MAG: hypothetical protein ABT25_02180 [Variovorax sp. SCN 67-20]OJZ11560.1 MAG: hypothetical protein BGP22_09520 [Variovorax sp. 67-131]